MADKIRPIPDSPDTDEPNVIATPEGDGEFNPPEPIHPLPEGALENPRGSDPNHFEPDLYKRDHP